MKFLKNFGALGTTQLVNNLAPLIILPILANRLGNELIGVLAIITASIAYIITIVDYGFSYSGTKEIARSDNIKEASNIYSQIILSKYILFILALPFYFFLYYLLPSIKEYFYLFVLSIAHIPFYILFAEFVFHGKEKMELITLINLVLKMLSVALTIFFVKSENDILYLPIINILSHFICAILSIYLCKLIDFKFIFNNTNLKLSIKRIKTEFNIFLSIFLPNLYNNTSILLLSAFASTSVVGVFDIARKITIIAEQVTTIYCRAYFPILSKNYQYRTIFIQKGIILNFILGLFLLIFGPVILNSFFNSEYTQSIILIKLFSLAPFVLFLSNIYGTSGLYLIGEEAALKKIILNSSIFSFFLSIPLIYFYHEYGVIIIIIFARFLIYILARSKFSQFNIKK